MIDEELIQRLRLMNEVDAFVAADRIEELASALKLVQTDGPHIKHARRADTAEAHLAKAVAALRFYATKTAFGVIFSGGDDGGRRASAALAVIGGGE
jgi:hypothetical protein